MFLCIGVLYDRMHSRQIADYGGVINTMPVFGAFMVLFAMANCGLPGTAGFVGEWMVILGAVKFNFWIGLLAATALILGAAYMLWLYQRMMTGRVASGTDRIRDLRRRELVVHDVGGVVLVHGDLFEDDAPLALHVLRLESLRRIDVRGREDGPLAQHPDPGVVLQEG